MKPQALHAKFFEGTCQASALDSAAFSGARTERAGPTDLRTHYTTTNIETINPLQNDITRINSAMS
jgi:hypothetical protein